MTLYERSYSFSDPNFSDTPVVENNEGTRTHLGQVRSAGQQYIAVIMKEVTDTENTVVKVIKKDATELHETVLNKSAKLWDVNDNGEVLLYTETQSGGTTIKELICLSTTGAVKWSVDLTSMLGDASVNAIEIGTQYAGIIYNDVVRFYDVSDGSEVRYLETGTNWVSNSNSGKNQECYGSSDGFTLVYKGSGNKVVFANKDGDVWVYDAPPFAGGFCQQWWITGRDTNCGRISIHNQGAPYQTCADIRRRCVIMWRTGESVEILEDGGIVPFLISPCGEWAIKVYGKISLYYIKKDGLVHVGDTSFASGEEGQQSIDLSFYGKYAIVLHNSGNLWAYQLKDAVSKDYVSNPLKSRAVMVCSD